MPDTEDMTTTPNPNTCPECGESYGFPVPSRYYAMVSHMVNKGELSVGEARAELASVLIDRDTAAFLAGWVMDRGDQGDEWRAGDPVRLPDGRTVAYVDEHDAMACPRDFVQTGDTTWERRREDMPCERGTEGCCVDHHGASTRCEAW